MSRFRIGQEVKYVGEAHPELGLIPGHLGTVKRIIDPVDLIFADDDGVRLERESQTYYSVDFGNPIPEVAWVPMAYKRDYDKVEANHPGVVSGELMGSSVDSAPSYSELVKNLFAPPARPLVAAGFTSF